MKRDHYFNVFYRNQDPHLSDLHTVRARFPQVNGHTPFRCYSVVVHHGGEGFLFVDTTRLVAFLRTLGTRSGRSGVCVPSRVPSLENLGRRRTTFVLLLEYLTS